MKKSVLLILFHLVMLLGYSQQVKVVDFDELEKKFKSPTDSLLVVNFWATWCGPCVEEMKYFIQAQDSFTTEKVKFIYVSLDFTKQMEKVSLFAKKKVMKGDLYILKDDPNNYINKIDKTWEGQIPFTLLITSEKKYITHNAPFLTFEELNQFIKTNFYSNR